MSCLSAYLLLPCVLLPSFALASPAQFHRRQAANITDASTLVVAATAHANALITFYPSRITDTTLWTLPTPTTIASTEIVYPGGYEWMPSPIPAFTPWPTIPSNAPYPTPAVSSLSSTVVHSSSNGANSGLSSATISSLAGSSGPTSVGSNGATSGISSKFTSSGASGPATLTGIGSSGTHSNSATGPASAGTGTVLQIGSVSHGPTTVSVGTASVPSSTGSLAGISSIPLPSQSSVMTGTVPLSTGSSVGTGPVSSPTRSLSNEAASISTSTGSVLAGTASALNGTNSNPLTHSIATISADTASSVPNTGVSSSLSGLASAISSTHTNLPTPSNSTTSSVASDTASVITHVGSSILTAASGSGKATSVTSTSPAGCVPSPTGSILGSASGSASLVYCYTSSSGTASQNGSSIATASETGSISKSVSQASTKTASQTFTTTAAASITSSVSSEALSSTSSIPSSGSSSKGAVSWSGSFTASPTQPTEALPNYVAPTTTVGGAAATSNAAVLGGLFFALQANRNWITDAALITLYIDQIENTKDQTLALINNLDVKPPSIPGCSGMTGRKRAVSKKPSSDRFARKALEDRGLFSVISGIAKDVGSLLSCAGDVVSNLENTVKLPEPPLDEIETLTDTLAEIGDDLQEDEKDEDDDPSHTASKNDPSNTASKSDLSNSASTPSSTGYSSTITSSARSSSVSSSSVSSSSSSSASSGTMVCAPTCAECNNENWGPVPTGSSKFKRTKLLEERTLPDPDYADSLNAYVMEQIEAGPNPSENAPGQGTEVMHRMSGTLSSAVTMPWLNAPKRIWVTGLFGCTVVIIISEGGVWVSHLWESPSFLEASDADFQTQVINAIQNGDGNNMPSPFGMQNAGGIFAPGLNTQIFVSTPNAVSGGGLMYGDRVTQVISSLTGAGQPFAGATVTQRGYLKAQTQAESYAIRNLARGKVLIQYDNNQVDDEEDPPARQQAIWRVWLETQMYQHEWDATPAQIGSVSTSATASASACPIGNRKRQAGASSDASCGRPVSTGVSSSTDTGPTGSISTSTASSSAGAAASPGLSTVTGTSTRGSGTSSGFSTITGSAIPSTITTMPQSTSSSITTAPAFSAACYPFADPDENVNRECQCDGLPGMYPYLPSTSGQQNYNPCGYTTSPTTASASSVPPFTTTESDGEVVSCASSTWYNYAVNENPSCAGASQVVSTVASIASAYSIAQASSASILSVSAASASAASASASWASAAAVPSAACWILDDDGWGDSSFEIYGINGWAGPNGNSLENQLEGCGIISNGEWYTDGESEFDGQMRSTQYTYFELSFFKGGCVERAVHSAGGPPPGSGPGQLACQHKPALTDDESKAVQSLASQQLKAVQDVANGGTQTTGLGTEQLKEVDNSGTASAPAAGSSPDPALIASASAALPALMAAASPSASG